METTPEQAAEGHAIVQVLAAVLDRLVQANTTLAMTDPGQVTKFHAMKAPSISILQYLERIHKFASCSNECYVLALIYIDRMIQRNNFLLTELNCHRVLITAVLLAAKFFDDAYYNNAYYAKIGGVLVTEMNGLEVDFLFRINFSLHVTEDEFTKYRNELVLHSQQYSPVSTAVNLALQQPVIAMDKLQYVVPVQQHVMYYDPSSSLQRPSNSWVAPQPQPPQVEPVSTQAHRQYTSTPNRCSNHAWLVPDGSPSQQISHKMLAGGLSN